MAREALRFMAPPQVRIRRGLCSDFSPFTFSATSWVPVEPALPGSRGEPLTCSMYPQAETAAGRVDPFDPDNFKYEIAVKRIVKG